MTRRNCPGHEVFRTSDDVVLIAAAVTIVAACGTAIWVGQRDAKRGRPMESQGLLPDWLEEKLGLKFRSVSRSLKMMWDLYGPPTVAILSYVLGFLVVWAASETARWIKRGWVNPSLYGLLLAAGPVFSLLIESYHSDQFLNCGLMRCCTGLSFPCYLPGFIVVFIYKLTWVVLYPLISELRIIFRRYGAVRGDVAYLLFEQRQNIELLLLVPPKILALFILYRDCRIPIELFIVYVAFNAYGLWTMCHDKTYTYIKAPGAFYWVIKTVDSAESKLQLSLHSAMIWLFGFVALNAVWLGADTRSKAALGTFSSVVTLMLLLNEARFSYLGCCKPRPPPPAPAQPAQDYGQAFI